MDDDMINKTDNSKKPFVKKFSNEDRYFIYDVNTNQIVEVEKPVYDIADLFEEDNLPHLESLFKDIYPLEVIRHSYSEIQDARKQHGLFSFFRPEKNTMGVRSMDELKAVLENPKKQLLLELTRDCNLNCAYCATSGKYYDHKDQPLHMDITTCRAAIDFFYNRSNPDNTPTISFYGGEPLLRFDMIKEAVAYIQAKPGGHQYEFNITTNGTLLNKEHLNFFIQHHFYLMVSLDGPQNVNDRYRLFKNGKGTFNRIMNTLAFIKSHDPEYFKKKVSISSVLAPPYNTVNEIIDFFSNNEILKDVKGKIRSSGVNTDETTFLEDFGLLEKTDAIKNIENIFTENIKTAILENDLDRLTIEKKKLFITLYNIAKRQIKELPGYIQPIGSCHIGVRRLFVDVHGNFNICERVADKYQIGSLAKGFLYENILYYYKKFDEQMEECKNCWAMLHCEKCWSIIGYVDDFTGQFKEDFCQKNKEIILKAFILYTQLLEKDPHCFKSIEHAFDE